MNREQLIEQESETAFATWVEDVLQRFNWTVAHFRPAKTEKGWRTAVSCQGKGYPDYNAVKAPDACGLKSRVRRARRHWSKGYG